MSHIFEFLGGWTVWDNAQDRPVKIMDHGSGRKFLLLFDNNLRFAIREWNYDTEVWDGRIRRTFDDITTTSNHHIQSENVVYWEEEGDDDGLYFGMGGIMRFWIYRFDIEENSLTLLYLTTTSTGNYYANFKDGDTITHVIGLSSVSGGNRWRIWETTKGADWENATSGEQANLATNTDRLHRRDAVAFIDPNGNLIILAFEGLGVSAWRTYKWDGSNLTNLDEKSEIELFGFNWNRYSHGHFVNRIFNGHVVLFPPIDTGPAADNHWAFALKWNETQENFEVLGTFINNDDVSLSRCWVTETLKISENKFRLFAKARLTASTPHEYENQLYEIDLSQPENAAVLLANCSPYRENTREPVGTQGFLDDSGDFVVAYQFFDSSFGQRTDTYKAVIAAIPPILAANQINNTIEISWTYPEE